MTSCVGVSGSQLGGRERLEVVFLGSEIYSSVPEPQVKIKVTREQKIDGRLANTE